MFFGIISYWWFAVISCLTWLSTLLGLLLYWAVKQHSKYLVDMDLGQTIPYISDIGALDMKPLFIAGSCVTVLSLDMCFIANRWLRHNGRLLPNVRTREKFISVMNILCAIGGSVGLILLSIFDTYRHPDMHGRCLYVFIIGFIASAVFASMEYWLLSHTFQNQKSLKASFWVKASFIFVEIVLAIAFAIETAKNNVNGAVICEWMLAFIFSFYALSYVLDLHPALRTKDHTQRYNKSSTISTYHTGSESGGVDIEPRNPPSRPPMTHMQHF